MRVLFILAVVLGFISCEKIIDVNIPDSDPQIVIQGLMNTDTNVYSVFIKTTIPYNSTDENYINDAIVTLSDDQGFSQQLTFVGNGEYQTTPINGVIGRNYTLRVEHQGEVYENYSMIRTPVPLDSIQTVFVQENSIPGVQEGTYLQVFYTDPVGLGDRYRIIFSRNDTVFSTSDDYFLSNDAFDDGLQDIVSFFGERFMVKPGDKVKIEFWTLDERVYDYYQTLENIISEGFAPSGVPDNPNSAWTNEALGFFNAYSYDADSLIVQ